MMALAVRPRLQLAMPIMAVMIVQLLARTATAGTSASASDRRRLATADRGRQLTTVGCVGDSITEGVGASCPPCPTKPSPLQPCGPAGCAHSWHVHYHACTRALAVTHWHAETLRPQRRIGLCDAHWQSLYFKTNSIACLIMG